MTKKHSDAETSKIEEKVKKLEKTNEHLLSQNVKGAKTNQTLLASEEKYQSLIESSDDPIYLVDRELKYLYANKKLLSRYGKSLSEMTGQSYANFHSPEATKLFSNRVKEVLKSGKPVTYEYKSQRDGKDFLRTLNPFINRSTGEITAITVISKDITIQKQMARALEKSEEKLRNFIDSSTIGIWCFRLESPVDISSPKEKMLIDIFKSVCVECNETYAVMMGATKDEILGTVLYEVMPDTEENRDYLGAFINNNFQISGGISHELGKNGLEKYFSNSMVGTIKNGKLVEAWGTQTDITELKHTEKKIQLLSQITENSPVAMVMLDMNKKITYVNPFFLKLYGYDSEEILNKPVLILSGEDDPEKHYSNIFNIVGSEGLWRGHDRRKRKDGTIFWASSSVAEIKDEKGNIFYYSEASRDITIQKRSEERIKHLNRILLAVRNVNQLITKENDRGNLIEKSCNLLVETRGYLDVWIAILDEKGKMTKYANAGDSEYISKMSEILKSGKITPCGIESLKRSEITITKPGQPICSGCPVFDYDIDKGVMTIPLKYENKIYGVAAATVPAEMLTDEEEQSLFREVTGDIAFALWKMEMEEEKHKLEEIESSILHSVPLAVIGLHERQITFANESVKDVFGWDAAELIGKKSRILYRSDEEYEKIADLFYPVLEKQQTHSEEFPCRRKDGKDIICMISAARIGMTLKDREIVVTYADITERKRAEEALRDSEENFRNIFHFVPESLLAVNDKIEVLNSNKAFEKLICKYAPELDMSEKELRKKIISELRKRFGKTNHGLIEIRKTTEK
jgi:PAS domain S-box-containing protein